MTYPSHFSLEQIVRPNILALQPYRCARDDYQSGILLDANENSLGHCLPEPSGLPLNGLGLNRYPDPSHDQIKGMFASLRGLPDASFIFLGVGSDEVIDLLFRISCIPAKDKVLVTPPTYGMYAVCAQVNDVAVLKVPLEVEGGSFQLRLDEIKRVISQEQNIKLVFICSPGNPTGTTIPLKDIQALLEYPDFKGLVVVDEAYIDFAGEEGSAVSLIERYANICVTQTLSKSFGLAAIRLGVAMAQPSLIRILSNTKAPYNISSLTAHAALSALSSGGIDLMKSNVASIKRMQTSLIDSLKALRPLGLGETRGGNHANFVLVPVLRRGFTSDNEYDNARAIKIYKKLAEDMGVVVRYRGGELGCEGCLRITVGTEEENRVLLNRLEQALSQE
ncbi:histidinol-phosphate transaminase [Tulasnella sp. UAMH 9824]|nr:histidinol-phosphate transaminase [Tulasnella sp. UAMH 9824]